MTRYAPEILGAVIIAAAFVVFLHVGFGGTWNELIFSPIRHLFAWAIVETQKGLPR